jgi:hypothetical protein
MPDVKSLIEKEIEKHAKQVGILSSRLMDVESGKIDNLQSPRVCSICKTINYHYYPDKDIWCCAFC